MKHLSGDNLVDYISERQAKQIRALVQSRCIQPKLAVISTNPEDLPSLKYIKLKSIRAKELGIEMELYEIPQKDVEGKIKELSIDESVHGIILQLPLLDSTQTEEFIKLIPPQKDVDGIGDSSIVEPATAQAILWLLTGYGIDLKGQNILVIGKGRLVGAPLIKMLEAQGLSPRSLDDSATQKELEAAIKDADIIISATGSPGLIRPEMLKNKQVIVDAGTSEDGGELRGDVSPEVHQSKLNIKITPTTGGLGPLTISCLFENLILLIDKTTS